MPKTGATRYQKFLKSEKSKTKLKSKKELPKGTNVTKTNFKIKKIVIREQLKKHSESEVLTTRKLNVKELLSRLNHFNTHSRIEALNGLKEVITSHPAILVNNLGELVHGITPLVLNVEKTVRQESFKVLYLMLSNAESVKIDPFFDIICTYLRSAMTHIDNRIQEDSLLFLDILLLYTPKRVAQDFHKIIPNFLDMISKLRVDSKPGRTLTINLGSQITSVKWRVKVLLRLKDYLNKFVKYNNINTKKEITQTTVRFDSMKLNHYPLFNPIYIQTCHMSCFSSRNMQDTEPLDEVEKFKEYVDTLMPLLFETWLEVCPHTSSMKNMETVIPEDAAALLKHTLEVISLIWNLVQHFNTINPGSETLSKFSQKYRQLYLKHIVNSFPYVTNIRSKQKNVYSPLENTISDPKLVEQNLEICHIFILLNLNINVKNQNNDIVSVLNYIEKTITQDVHDNDNTNNVIVKILHTIFTNNINNWTKNLSVMDDLFKKIIWAYFNKSVSSQLRQEIFSVLCKIALNNKLIHFHKCDTYKVWLQNLPDILLEEEVTVQTIDTIHKFAVTNNSTFCSIIKPKLTKVIQNLPKIRVSNANDTSVYYKLFSLLFYIKEWDPESLDILENQLLDNVYSKNYVNFILETLNYAHNLK